MKQVDIQQPAPKMEWTTPEFRTLEAGAAESQRGANTDGGGGSQGS